MKLKGQEMGLQLANLASQIKLNESQANKNNAEANKTAGVDAELAKTLTLAFGFASRNSKNFSPTSITPPPVCFFKFRINNEIINLTDPSVFKDVCHLAPEHG